MNPPMEPNYRLNVGIALFNASGQVLIARRLWSSGPEIIMPGHEWQMPQGGIDAGEDPLAAAFRELEEETSVTSAVHLGGTDGWIAYDFPPYDGPPHHLSPFRGQRQKWFAMRFTGHESEIDVTLTHGSAVPEFAEWRWQALADVPALVVPFKRAVYERVAEAFAPFATPV